MVNFNFKINGEKKTQDETLSNIEKCFDLIEQLSIRENRNVQSILSCGFEINFDINYSPKRKKEAS